jgi:hypothetical protein
VRPEVSFAAKYNSLTHKWKIAQEYVERFGPRDLISFYREIGISAVAKPMSSRHSSPCREIG